MWGPLGGLCAGWSSRRVEPSRPEDGCKRAPRCGSPIGEAAQQNDVSNEMELGMPRETSTFRDSPCAVRALQSDEQQPGQLEDASAILLADTSSPEVSRMTASSVRFATSDARERDQAATASVIPSECVPNEDTTAGVICKAPLGWRGTRVRLLLPSDSAKSSGGGGGGGGGAAEVSTAIMAVTATAAAGPSRRMTTGTSSSKADGEPRALAQLASLLLAHQVDYRSELEDIIATYGPEFPKGLLEDMLERHRIPLPQKRLHVIGILYRMEEGQAEVEVEARRKVARRKAENDDSGKGGDEMIDAVALLKDLDRAAFRHMALGALASGPGGGVQPGGEGASTPGATGTAVNSRKNLAASAQLGDKSRIFQLVASQLATDESLRIRAGRGEDLTPEHLQEVVEQIDLTSVAVPVGTRAPYVPSTEDPDSFHVPVWSLRAMQLRKQQRDQALLGSDPHLHHLGQAGREALRSQLTSRSLFQQQEIIANAVVAAARAAVAPSLRLTENVIQLAGTSRMSSLQRMGSRSSTSPQRRSATTIPATTAGYGSAAADTTATTQSDEGAARGGSGLQRETTMKGTLSNQRGEQLQSVLSEVVSAGISCSDDGGFRPSPIVRQQMASASGGNEARALSSPSARQVTSSSPSSSSPSCGSRSGPLASNAVMGGSSCKALDTARSGTMIQPVKIMSSAQTSVSHTYTPSLPLHPALQPPLPPSPKQQQDREAQAGRVLRQPQTHQMGEARQEPLQLVALVQGGGSTVTTMEAVQQVAGCASPSPPSPQGKSAWGGGGNVRDCIAGSMSRSTVGSRDGRSGGAGCTASAAGIKDVSTDVSIRMSAVDRSGDEFGGEVGRGLVPPASPLLLRPAMISNEPQRMSEAGLPQSARGLEAMAQHRQMVKARSSCTRRPSNPGSYSIAHPSVSSPGLRSTNVGSDVAELPGQCIAPEVSSPVLSPPPASPHVTSIAPLLGDVENT